MPALRLSLLIALLGLVVGDGQADESTAIIPLQQVSVDAGGRKVLLRLAVFSSRNFSIRIIDNVAPGDQCKFATLVGVMEEFGGAAGCNGGFFERHPFHPVGLMRSDGRQTGTLDRTSWMKGLLVLRGNEAALESTVTFEDASTITQLLQAGPWLVQGGKAADNKQGPLSRRTFICYDGRGNWALGASDPCSLGELAALLRDPAVTAIIDIQDALNMDGGPSTGLWIKGAQDNFYLPERWTVANYLGVFPRPKP